MRDRDAALMDSPNLPNDGASGRDALAALLVARGACDTRAIERARRIATDSHQPLERVLAQLGLVGERDIATAAAEILGARLVLRSILRPSNTAP